MLATTTPSGAKSKRKAPNTTSTDNRKHRSKATKH